MTDFIARLRELYPKCTKDIVYGPGRLHDARYEYVVGPRPEKFQINMTAAFWKADDATLYVSMYHALPQILALVEAAQRADDDLRSEFGNRVADINFGYLIKALAALRDNHDV